MPYEDPLNKPADPALPAWAAELSGYDASPPPPADLSGYGESPHVPAGIYECRVDRGELTLARSTGNRLYLLTLVVLAGEHAGARLYKRCMMHTIEDRRRAGAVLGPLGLTKNDLLKPFPPPGATVVVRAGVTVGKYKGAPSNDVEWVEFVRREDAPANPNAVDPDELLGGAAGA